MKIKKISLIVSVILIGAFLRFYKLDVYPIQLNHDEISQLYDTGSIIQTGKDIYGNFLPLAFPSTGDFKVGHYIYITVLPYLLLGMNELTIRIPSAFFGSLGVLSVFLFINILTKNFKIALLSAGLVAITPSEIFYSRKSFESVIAASFTYLGLFMLFKILDEKTSKQNIFLTSLFLSLPMYLYTSYTIIIPLILASFYLCFRKNIHLRREKFVQTFIIWLLMIIPLIFLILSNTGIRYRANSVFLSQDINLGRQFMLIDIQNNALESLYKFKFTIEYGFTKYLNQFDLSLIFGKGLDLTNQGLIGLGPLLLVQLPFFVLGILSILRSNFFENRGKFLLIITALCIIPSGITFETVSPHRSVLTFSLMSIISAFGFFKFNQLLSNPRFIFLKIASLVILVGAFILNLIYATHIYTVNFPYEKSQQIHYPYREVALYAWSNYNNFDKIIIDPKYGQTAPVRAVAVHYYLAYYGDYSPSKFQNDLKMGDLEITFDKFVVREVDWRSDHQLKNVLIIASPWSLPESVIKEKKILKTFTFYDNSPAFYAIEL